MKETPRIFFAEFAPSNIATSNNKGLAFQQIRHDCGVNVIDEKMYKIDPPVYECSLCHKLSDKQTKKCKWCGCEFGKEYSLWEVTEMLSPEPAEEIFDDWGRYNETTQHDGLDCCDKWGNRCFSKHTLPCRYERDNNSDTCGRLLESKRDYNGIEKR